MLSLYPRSVSAVFGTNIIIVSVWLGYARIEQVSRYHSPKYLLKVVPILPPFNVDLPIAITKQACTTHPMSISFCLPSTSYMLLPAAQFKFAITS